jgi:hypothetical protein
MSLRFHFLSPSEFILYKTGQSFIILDKVEISTKHSNTVKIKSDNSVKTHNTNYFLKWYYHRLTIKIERII